MQIQLVKFHTFSQPSVQESDLPSFDDAFDKDSLRKFFKDQDSQMGTPFTTYTEAPMYEDLQSTFSDKNIFGSPFTNYINLNLSSEMEDAPNSKVFQMLEEQEEKSVKNPFKLHRVPVQQRLFEDNSMTLLEDKSRINISFGDNETSLEKDTSSSLFNQFAEASKKVKKPVFTILRNVMPKAIAKVEKETKKAPILEKAKKALKEKKEEKKKQAQKEETKEDKKEEKEEKTAKKNKRKTSEKN